MGKTITPVEAQISWERDTRKVFNKWPKSIQQDFGISLGEMQKGLPAFLTVRPMPSVGTGVFELKDGDGDKWYRMMYLCQTKGTIYILHCFTKNTRKTERPDIQTAERRLKHIQERLRQEEKDEKYQSRAAISSARNKRKHSR